MAIVAPKVNRILFNNAPEKSIVKKPNNQTANVLPELTPFLDNLKQMKEMQKEYVKTDISFNKE